ncbi:tetratricopeptide repeat protein [Deinococcus sp. HMF7620]|uniref:Tetratricopeptide repeat protein n=1 Tax=Deinococcus arboris TaxID=2682977 RepID=A0A7C9HQY0_9DEIO|nr:tetratricopeptide repeat protein [Deinococcus arboris]MVN86552.1 tetratricopeptide repeat protein [Deinococcus arboris]
MRLPVVLLTAGLLVGAGAFGVSRWQADKTRPMPAAQTVVPPVTPAPVPPTIEAQPEVTVDPEPAAEPAPAPKPDPVPVPKPAPPPAALLPAHASVSGIRHEYQRLNNCGPVTIGMALSRWDSTLTQYDIAPKLKPSKGDVNTSPDELAAYARSQGMDVHLARGGDRTMLRTLLAAGFPVIVETWFITHDSGGMGHYRLLTGYDDAAQTYSALDSYLGPLKMDYAKFDALWRSFGRTFLVVSAPAKAEQVRALLGQRADPAAARAETLRVAQAEATRLGDAVAYLNLGEAKLALGDSQGAARAFDQALAARPDPALDPTRPGWVQGGLAWRALWYTFGPFEAYTRTGQYDKVMALTGAVLRSVPTHEEAHYWRARALAGLGRTAQAQAAYREALRLRPGYAAAQQELARL